MLTIYTFEEFKKLLKHKDGFLVFEEISPIIEREDKIWRPKNREGNNIITTFKISEEKIYNGLKIDYIRLKRLHCNPYKAAYNNYLYKIFGNMQRGGT